MDPPGAPSGSGRGEKRPASDAVDASDLFKRGGPKSIRASAAPRVDAGGRHAGDAEGAWDDGPRARRPHADADAEDGTGAPGAWHSGGSRGRGEDDADGGTLRSRPRLLAKFRALCGALARRLSAHADNVTVAVWRAELGVAEVLRPRGKHLNRMGYHVGARAFLFPEETVFLVETERLALLASAASAAPLSLRAVRALCVGRRADEHAHENKNTHRSKTPALSGDAYALYAHFARRGYVARRFGAPWIAPDASDKKKADHATYAGAGPAPARFGGTAGTAPTGFDDDVSEAVSEDAGGTRLRRDEPNERSAPRAKEKETTLGPRRGWYPSAARWLAANAELTSPLGTPREVHIPTVSHGKSGGFANSEASSHPAPVPAFRAHAPNGNFSRKHPGPTAFYAFLSEEGSKKANGAHPRGGAPSSRAAAGATAPLRRELGEERLEGKIAWASVADGVVVLHGFETLPGER